MEKLSPEDISRAEFRADEILTVIEPKFARTPMFTVSRDILASMIAEKVAAYSAAENERLTLERDRLKGALLRLAKLVEDGVLVRNTNDDATLGSFVEQAVRLTRVLKETQEALA